MKTESDHAAELAKMSDDDLLDEMRHQVNLSRHTTAGHNRERTRALGDELRKRGLLQRKYPPHP